MKEAGSAFLKKSAQKTFARLDRAGETACGPVNQKFFASVLQKRSTAFFASVFFASVFLVSAVSVSAFS
jgi:hypothetical protein